MSRVSQPACVGTSRLRLIIGLISPCIYLVGCPKHNAMSDQTVNPGSFTDPDTAYGYYEKALKAAPLDVEYKSRAGQFRLEASQDHIRRGQAAIVQGQLQFALGEFQRALHIDPGSSAAEQEIRNARKLIGRTKDINLPPGTVPRTTSLAEGPPQLKPLSTSPINVKMSNDAKIVYDTIGKLAGLTVIFDAIRLKEGEVSILGGLFERVDTKTLNGWPGLAHIPLLRYLFSSTSNDHQDNEILIVMVPRIIRLPAVAQADLRPIGSGTESNVQVRRIEAVLTPVTPSAGNTPSAAATPGKGVGSPDAQPTARVRFAPDNLKLKVGQSASVDVIIDNVTDFFAVALLLHCDPQIIGIEEVHHGGFLSAGTQDIALVQRIEKDRGLAVISLTRQPNTVGITGSGTLISVVIRGIVVGSSKLSIDQINARGAQQKQIPVLTGEALVQVGE
jgi:hypothetical protein